jgi:uncharacterized surface protein with fasciclin (FAS1) repeats
VHNISAAAAAAAAATLLQVLSYHIIPGMLRSSQLTERQALPTALAGAAPLVVKVSSPVDFNARLSYFALTLQKGAACT